MTESLGPPVAAVAELSASGEMIIAIARATPRFMRNLDIVAPFFREVVTG